MEVIKIRNGKADYLFTLDEEGGKQLLETLNVINSIDTAVFVLADVFFDNANDFLKYSSSIIKDVEITGNDFILNFGKYQRKSSKYLMGVLTSFFSFIEVTPELLSRDIKASEVGIHFLKQIEYYENNSFEFRFLRKFRNYVQHRNLPFRNLNLDYIVTGDKSIRGVIELDRDELIKYGKWKNKDDKFNIGEELQKMDCRIILEPIVKSVMLCVVSIMDEIIESVFNKYSNHIISLLKLYNDAVSKGGEKQLALMMPNQESNNARIMYFNLDIIERIKSMYTLEAFE